MNTQPTESWELDHAAILMYGRPTDWRTSRLQQLGDEHKALEVIRLLGELAVKHNLQRIQSPTVSDFNSQFLSDGFQYPWKLSLPGTACRLHRGLRGDGFEVHKGNAGIIAPADCAVVVATTPKGRVLMLHAGRDSLVDRTLIETGRASKQYESIIFAAWRELYRVDREDALCSEWFILPSISTGPHFQHRWDDPLWGEKNRNLVNYLTKKYGLGCVYGDPALGMIDIATIIGVQLNEYCGLNLDQMKSVGRCTYKEISKDGTLTWHSHARAMHKKENPESRNLVVVINSKS